MCNIIKPNNLELIENKIQLSLGVCLPTPSYGQILATPPPGGDNSSPLVFFYYNPVVMI
jgi:hypothetical protein